MRIEATNVEDNPEDEQKDSSDEASGDSEWSSVSHSSLSSESR